MYFLFFKNFIRFFLSVASFLVNISSQMGKKIFQETRFFVDGMCMKNKKCGIGGMRVYIGGHRKWLVITNNM